MKKVFIMAIAVAAMTLASCNNGKTNAPKANADSDTTESVATDSATTAAAPASADQLIEQLNEKVKAKDDKGVAALLTAAQTKMAELAQKDPKEAQAYVAKLQQWMQSNSENIKAALKSNAVGAAIDAASKADPKAITEGMSKAKEAMQSASPEQVEAAKKAAKEAAEKMQGKSGEAAQKAMKDLGL